MRWFKRSADATGSTEATPAAASAASPPRHIGRIRVLLAALLCLANAGVSGLLLLQHHGEERAVATVSKVCGPGEQSGCDVVARSRYSAIRGLPLAAFGLFLYLSLALLLLLATLVPGPEMGDAAAGLALLGLVVALAIDVILLGVQMVAIRAFCRLCLLTYAFTALALVALLPARRDGTVVGRALGRPEGRLAFTAWLAMVGLLGVGVLASDAALSYRERARSVAILGLPPSGTRLPPAPPGSEAQRYQEEARMATEQARRLQEILDDPNKLKQYFDDRAAREYDQAPVQTLKLDGVPFKGPAQAPIRVVEFSDFLCPFCQGAAVSLSQYLPKTAGRITVYYKNYPLDENCNPNVKPSLHPGACLVALGAVCANDQGRFWSYHDRVFSSPPRNPQAPDVIRIATEAGVDAAVLQTCLSSQSAKDRLSAEIKEGYDAGVRGTPTMFINGKRLPRLEDFVNTVNKESARQGLPPLPPPTE